MEDRRHDIETRDRISKLEATTYKKLKTIKHLVYVFILISVVTSAAAGYLINDNRHRSDRIQQSRATNMYNACIDSNARNKRTRYVLHKVINDTVRSGQITANGGAASEAFTILLINALAPVRDCNAIVLNQPKKTPRDQRS